MYAVEWPSCHDLLRIIRYLSVSLSFVAGTLGCGFCTLRKFRTLVCLLTSDFGMGCGRSVGGGCVAVLQGWLTPGGQRELSVAIGGGGGSRFYYMGGRNSGVRFVNSGVRCGYFGFIPIERALHVYTYTTHHTPHMQLPGVRECGMGIEHTAVGSSELGLKQACCSSASYQFGIYESSSLSRGMYASSAYRPCIACIVH